MNTSEIAIKVENLSKCYHIYDKPRDRLFQMLTRGRKQYFREFWALKDVSFEIKKGETVGIIGRNGSGKSTLLQMICGTLNPTSGSIQTNGRIAALLELGSGFNPEFTGRENVYMSGAVFGLSREEVDNTFDEILAFSEIGGFIEQPVKTYSSGMFVRLAFAVQAVVDPDIFIIDEALAVGDEKFQRKCFARLEELKSKGTSILFVSHSPASIVELCDKTLLLNRGKRLMYAKATEAIRAYQKLIYAPTEDEGRLIEEYFVADQLSDFELSLKQQELSEPRIVHSIESFDPGLAPETTTVYPVQGAAIDSMQILDANGRSVNLLKSGACYQFVVTGHFINNLSAVCFGISIKSISGLIITGQRFPEDGKFIDKIDAGKAVKIVYTFRIDVLPGTYFVGGGIWSLQQTILDHRIEDAIMFRVLSNEKQHSFGYVDSSFGETTLEII